MAGPPVVPSTTAANTTAPTPTTDDHVAAAATVVRQFLDFDTATGLMASDDLINDSNNNDDDDHNDVVVVSENRVASPAMVTTTKLSHSKQLEDMGGAGMAAPVAAPLLPVDMARASMGDALADPNGIAAAPTESASEVVSVKQQLRKLLPRPKVDVSVEIPLKSLSSADSSASSEHRDMPSADALQELESNVATPTLSSAEVIATPIDDASLADRLRAAIDSKTGALKPATAAALTDILKLVWNCDDRARWVDVIGALVKTRSKVFYQRIVSSANAMSLLKRWFTTGIKEKDGPVLAGMLELLDVLPMTLDALKANPWGKLVKALTKSTDTALQSQSTAITSKWMALVVAERAADTAPAAVEGRKHERDVEALETSASVKKAKRAAANTAASPATSPVTTEKATSSATKTASMKAVAGVKAPPKPSASSTKTTTTTTTTTKRAAPAEPAAPRTKPVDIFDMFDMAPAKKKVKPSTAVARTRTAVATTAGVSTPNSEAASADGQMSSGNASVESLVSRAVSPVEQVGERIPTVSAKTGKPKKVVRWAPPGRLTKIKVFEKETWEDDMGVVPGGASAASIAGMPPNSSTHRRSARDMERGEARAAIQTLQDEMKERAAWRLPHAVILPNDQQKAADAVGSESVERSLQREFEQRTLEVRWFEARDVPASPGEPERDEWPGESTAAPIKLDMPPPAPIALASPTEAQQPAPVQSVIQQLLAQNRSTNAPLDASVIGQLLSNLNHINQPPAAMPAATQMYQQQSAHQHPMAMGGFAVPAMPVQQMGAQMLHGGVSATGFAPAIGNAYMQQQRQPPQSQLFAQQHYPPAQQQQQQQPIHLQEDQAQQPNLYSTYGAGIPRRQMQSQDEYFRQSQPQTRQTRSSNNINNNGGGHHSNNMPDKKDRPGRVIICRNFKTGTCKFGDRCHFKHQ